MSKIVKVIITLMIIIIIIVIIIIIIIIVTKLKRNWYDFLYKLERSLCCIQSTWLCLEEVSEVD